LVELIALKSESAEFSKGAREAHATAELLSEIEDAPQPGLRGFEVVTIASQLAHLLTDRGQAGTVVELFANRHRLGAPRLSSSVETLGVRDRA
jgi:hypothetical protein